MANKIVVGFPPNVQRETRGLFLRDLQKQLNGSVAVKGKDLNGGKVITVELNGATKARPAIQKVLSQHCRHMDVQFA